MKKRKQLILIFPRFKYPSGDIPWGLASLAAMVKSGIRDIDITLIDGGFKKDINFIANEFKEKRSGIVGIYMDSLMYEDAIKIAKVAKFYKMNVIVGGPHPTLFPEMVIFKECIDTVCIGEGENVMLKYVESYYDGYDFGKIKGIWFKRNKEVIKNGPPEPIENLDMLPRLDLQMLNIEKYIKNCIYMDSYNPNLRTIAVIASRGCPFKCSYCQPVIETIFGKSLRIRSPEKVVDDLLYWRERYNLGSFYFQDDNLTMFKDWIREFCNIAIVKKMNMVWVCNSRVDNVDWKLLDYLKAAGCIKIRFGIETASDRILNDIYNKKIDINMVKEAIAITKKKGIQTSGYFILGGPSETEREVRNTIDFASKSDLDEAVFTIFSPFPGTYLYKKALAGGGKLPKRFEDFDYYRAKRPKFTPLDIPREKLNIYKKRAFLKFYCHPKRLKKTFNMVINRRGLYKTIRKLKTYF